MKHFAFVVTKKRADRAGNSQDTMDVFRIVRNVPRVVQCAVHIGYRTPNQCAVDTLVHAKEIPARFRNTTAHAIAEYGVATIHEL